MNPLSYQIELFVLAVLLYLYDSTVLLYANEAILTRRGADRWTFSWGWEGFLLAGRTVCMLNPLAPQQPCYRLRWSVERIDAGGAEASWSETGRQPGALGKPVAAAGIALFALLPLGLFSMLGAWAILPAVALLYGSALLALVRLHGAREALGIGRRHFWTLAFECLACPPFAVNLLRRISLGREIREPLTLAAARLLAPAQWARLRADCLARVNAALQAAEDGSEEYLLLQAQKKLLGDSGGTI